MEVHKDFLLHVILVDMLIIVLKKRVWNVNVRNVIVITVEHVKNHQLWI